MNPNSNGVSISSSEYFSELLKNKKLKNGSVLTVVD
jgi:hypothetical protein